MLNLVSNVVAQTSDIGHRQAQASYGVTAVIAAKKELIPISKDEKKVEQHIHKNNG